MDAVVAGNSGGPLDVGFQSGQLSHGTAEQLNGLIRVGVERTRPDLEQLEAAVEELDGQQTFDLELLRVFGPSFVVFADELEGTRADGAHQKLAVVQHVAKALL